MKVTGLGSTGGQSRRMLLNLGVLEAKAEGKLLLLGVLEAKAQKWLCSPKLCTISMNIEV